jgi:uncharacterized membrane protein YphA (DoxX/SURF4 family)
MTNARSAAAAAGRLLMSIIFILAGLQKLGAAGDTVAYMAIQGLPAPGLAAAVAIAVECIGGAFVLAGYQTRRVGLILAVWCINQMAHFLKNQPWPAASCCSSPSVPALGALTNTPAERQAAHRLRRGGRPCVLSRGSAAV